MSLKGPWMGVRGQALPTLLPKDRNMITFIDLGELALLKRPSVGLKVGSCPNDDSSVDFFCPFLCNI